jgi:integrase
MLAERNGHPNNPGHDSNFKEFDMALIDTAVRHNPFLPLAELPELLRALRDYPGMERTTRQGLRLLLFTGVRTGELRHVTPDQFDLERSLWSIPPKNVKQLQRQARQSKRDMPPYLVPLSTQAVFGGISHGPPQAANLSRKAFVCSRDVRILRRSPDFPDFRKRSVMPTAP